MVPAHSNDVSVARLIGFEVKEIADGRAVVSLAEGQRDANPMGTLHGGTVRSLPRRRAG
jgi:acyl-coenzyme A thioesterase PaaI-like protein